MAGSGAEVSRGAGSNCGAGLRSQEATGQLGGGGGAGRGAGLVSGARVQD